MLERFDDAFIQLQQAYKVVYMDPRGAELAGELSFRFAFAAGKSGLELKGQIDRISIGISASRFTAFAAGRDGEGVFEDFAYQTVEGASDFAKRNRRAIENRESRIAPSIRGRFSIFNSRPFALFK